MDAYDISQKMMKYWMALVPKSSGELTKLKHRTPVIIMTPEGYREVRGVVINGDKIELVLDNE